MFQKIFSRYFKIKCRTLNLTLIINSNNKCTLILHRIWTTRLCIMIIIELWICKNNNKGPNPCFVLTMIHSINSKLFTQKFPILITNFTKMSFLLIKEVECNMDHLFKKHKWELNRWVIYTTRCTWTIFNQTNIAQFVLCQWICLMNTRLHSILSIKYFAPCTKNAKSL